MTRVRLTATALAVLALLPGVLAGAGRAWAQPAQPDTTQSTPLATEPLPAQGPGQAVTGAAVGGSAPGPRGPSTVDNSLEQGGAVLKPGAAAGDMGAAAGTRQLEQQPPK